MCETVIHGIEMKSIGTVCQCCVNHSFHHFPEDWCCCLESSSSLSLINPYVPFQCRNLSAIYLFFGVACSTSACGISSLILPALSDFSPFSTILKDSSILIFTDWLRLLHSVYSMHTAHANVASKQRDKTERY